MGCFVNKIYDMLHLVEENMRIYMYFYGKRSDSTCFDRIYYILWKGSADMVENKFPVKMQKENEQYPEGYSFGNVCLVGSFAESNVFYRVYVAQNQYLNEVG